MTLGFALLALAAGSARAGQGGRTELPENVEAFIDSMVLTHGFGRDRLRRLFGRVRTRRSIIRAMSAPATARPWHQFRASHVTGERIDGGVAFWRRHVATLERADREYGVPPEVIVATIGIETHYGRVTGSYRVIDALSTLAFRYPPRAERFRRELEEYLLLTREARLDPLALKGSYAGAIGIPQFLPSSYRSYAVDFDDDGKRDLVGSPADAIGSVANYYRSFGWFGNDAAVVPADASGSPADAVDAGNIRPELSVGELRRRGIVPLAPVNDDTTAALFVVETEAGPQHWLGLNNFYVITRYNRSINYAMAVLELAEAIRDAMRR